jgi:hypothetical protein
MHAQINTQPQVRYTMVMRKNATKHIANGKNAR